MTVWFLVYYYSSDSFKHIYFKFNISYHNKHDDVKSQNKPAALCIVGFIGGPLSDNTVIIPPF